MIRKISDPYTMAVIRAALTMNAFAPEDIEPVCQMIDEPLEAYRQHSTLSVNESVGIHLGFWLIFEHKNRLPTQSEKITDLVTDIIKEVVKLRDPDYKIADSYLNSMDKLEPEDCMWFVWLVPQVSRKSTQVGVTLIVLLNLLAYFIAQDAFREDLKLQTNANSI